MRHVAAPVIAVLVGTAAIGGAVFLWAPRETASPVTPVPPRNALARPAPQPSAFAWQLVGAASHAGAMVLEVETTRPGDAGAIAQQLTEPYTKDHDEVLVYFYEPNASPRLAFKRVQWTRRRGYRTTDFPRQP